MPIYGRAESLNLAAAAAVCLYASASEPAAQPAAVGSDSTAAIPYDPIMITSRCAPEGGPMIPFA